MTVTAETAEQQAAPTPSSPTSWVTPLDIATAHGKSVDRIRTALQEGRLHGHQGGFRGSWLVRADVVDAWLANATPEAQLEACSPHCPDRQARRKGSRR